jgi:hypothetical protein
MVRPQRSDEEEGDEGRSHMKANSLSRLACKARAIIRVV